MQLENDFPARLARFSFTLAMGLVWCGVPQHTLAGPPGSTLPSITESDKTRMTQLADSLEQTLRLYTAIDRGIPRDSFDPQAVVKTVGNDDSKLFEWVRDHTRYVPYRGALRGASGVLMDGAGNSLDRSLLLARLLQLAGKEVRLARGSLSDSQAQGLLKSAWEQAPANADAAPKDEQTSEAFLAKWAAENQINPVELQRQLQQGRLVSEKRAEQLATGVADQTDRLLAIVKPAAGDGAAEHAIQLAAIADHWWVQEKRDVAWIDLDVLPPDAKVGSRLIESAQTVALPAGASMLPLKEQDVQSIEVRVVGEQWKGGATENKVALKQSLRPAELGGMPVTLSLIPAKWPQDLDPTATDAPAIIRAALEKQTTWAPMITVGGQTIVQNGFDDQGNLVAHPLDDMPGAAVAGAVGRAASVLDAIDAPAAAEGKFTAAWIEFETKVPGRPSTVVRRDLFDLFGPAKRAAGNLSDPMIDPTAKLMRGIGMFRSLDLLPVGAVLSEDFILHAQLHRTIESGPVLMEALRGAGKKSLSDSFSDVARKRPLPAPLLALAAGRRGIDGEQSGIAVDRPNLFALHYTMTFTRGGRMLRRTSTDIIENRTAIRPAAGVDAFAARVRQGVMETQLEAASLGSGRAGHNTAALFSASVPQKVQWTLFRGPNDAALTQVNLSPNSRARIASELKAGYVVCAPAASIKSGGIPQTGWWRVDPADGNCVGYMSDGMGTAAVEHSSLGWWIAAGESVWGVIECTGEFHGWAAVGCSVCAIAIAVGIAITHTSGFGELVVGHTMAKACTALGGEHEGGEGGGEGGGGAGGGEGGGGGNYTPSGGSSQDPGMSSVGGGE